MTIKQWFAIEGNPFTNQYDLAKEIGAIRRMQVDSINSQLSKVANKRIRLTEKFKRHIKTAILERCGDSLGEKLFNAWLEVADAETLRLWQIENTSAKTDRLRMPQDNKELEVIHAVEALLGIRLPDRLVSSILTELDRQHLPA